MAKMKAAAVGRRRDVDMTEGNILRHLILFALPLLAGNIFQQFYNMVDTWVVGNYVSNEAFSAVGSVGPIINMLIGTFMGLSSGAGAVISQYYGAKQFEQVEKAIHTSVLMTLILGAAFTALGIGMTPLMLNLMDTPADVLPEAKSYLTIYFSGILGLMLYNMGSGILRAVGFGMSRVQLYRKIKNLTNYTPIEIIRITRLKSAQQLLASSDLTIAEITYQVGFTSPSYFTKCYKEYFGENPNDTRSRKK